MSPRLSAYTVVGHPDGAWMLTVVATRTYDVRSGQCAPSEAQGALVEAPVYSDDQAVLLRDTDLVAHRARVDVVVQGHAYALAGRPVFDASVCVGDLDRTLRVFGDRRPYRDRLGALRFTDPTPVERVPLGWERAYGGVDLASFERHGDPFAAAVRTVTDGAADPRFTVHGYPRNPVGRGYLIEPTDEALARCELPNFEHPSQLLTPETLPRGEFTRWPGGPVPAATGWLSYNYFPRLAMAGVPPVVYDDEALPPSRFAEVLLGDAPERSVAPETGLRQRVDVGVAQCAAVGMRAARVDPGAAVVLDFLHPRERSWRFNLSPERPRIVAQMPDEAIQELAPSIRTVLLAPDDDRVTVVWVADLRLSRPVGPGRFAKIQHAVRWPDAR